MAGQSSSIVFILLSIIFLPAFPAESSLSLDLLSQFSLEFSDTSESLHVNSEENDTVIDLKSLNRHTINDSENYSEKPIDKYTCRKPRFFDAILFVALCISCVILLCIVVIYGLVWDKQNVHGWTVCSLSLCLLICFQFFALTNAASLFQSSFLSHTMPLCIANGITHHFFYIAAFAWTTLLNYDLWSSITSMSAPVAEWSRFRGKKRFIYYCFFGFGFPLLVVLITNILVLGNFFGHQVEGRSCGHVICHIKKSARFYYAVIPSMFLYCVNLVFAALILKFLWDFQRGSKRLEQLNPSKHVKPQVGLFLKFFILTGLTRIFEILSWILGGDRATWYWAILDVYNILVNPAGLFWIFVCRKEIKEQLIHKYTFFNDFFKWADGFSNKLCSKQTYKVGNVAETMKLTTVTSPTATTTTEVPEDV